MAMISDLYGEAYSWYQLWAEPADAGHGGIGRKRTYCIGMHTEKSECLHDPFELWDCVREEIKAYVATRPGDYFTASKQEVLLEAQLLANRRSRRFRPQCFDMTYLLTEREARTVKLLQQHFYQTRRRRAEHDRDLVAFLGDSFSYSKTWSATSGKIPTFRRNAKSGVFWSFRHRRFLTSKEKLLCMGWPVLDYVAREMQVPTIPALDIQRAADMSGNGMHFGVVALMQMIALTCFGPV